MKNANSQKKLTARGLKIFYAVLTLCVCAAGALSYRALRGPRKSGESPQPQSTKPQTEPWTVNWEWGEDSDEGPDEETAPSEETVADALETLPAETQTREPENIEAAAPLRPRIERAARFVPPTETPVSKGFSGGELVLSKTMGDWRTHNGTDFKGTLGDPVKAINNGFVRAVYDDVLWGTVVEIDHGKGLVAKYCGLGKGSTISEGDAVRINDKVGNLSTIPAEAADDIHLHLELRQDGELIDPISVIG